MPTSLPDGHDVHVRRVEVDVVEQHLPLRPGAGDLLVHPVDAADHRGLAASRRADDRRHVAGLEREVHALDGMVVAVVRVQVLDLHLPGGVHLLETRPQAPLAAATWGAGVRVFRLGPESGASSSPRDRPRSGRHSVDSSWEALPCSPFSIISVQLPSRRARPGGERPRDDADQEDDDDQHQRGRPGLIVLRGRGRFRVLEDDDGDARAAPATGRSTGSTRRSRSRTGAAPSPRAARATASSAPVIIPLRAVGTTTDSVVRHRLAPSARPASLTEPGTRVKHLLTGARDERQHHDRERDRPGPAALMALSRHDEAEDEDAGDDRRHAVQDVEEVPDRWTRSVGLRTRSCRWRPGSRWGPPSGSRARRGSPCRRARWRSRRSPRLSWDRRSG